MVGASVAHHLARRGWDDLVLIDQGPLYGLDARLLEPAEVAELIGLLDPATILGGFHVADDGLAKALRATETMVREAGDAVSAFGETTLTGLRVERGRVRGVETSAGAIDAEHVVIAAGLWGPIVAKMLRGLEIPLVPVQHQLVYTAPLAELAGETRDVVHPILRHQDHSMYFRQVRDAYAIGNYRHEPRLTEPEDLPQPAEQPFSEADFVTAAEEAGRLLPALRGAELVRAFNGLMSFTPDGFPLLGESSAARGLWLAQAIWVTHSAGCGRALAELMTHGDAQIDLHEADAQRYDQHGTSRLYQRARGAQGYREVYDVIHPRQQSEQVRGLRTTPFYERQVQLGAEFFESAGWERPQWYEANAESVNGNEVRPSAWAAREWSAIAVAEHRACRERVGIFDLTPFTKVEVSGPGAAAFLQRLAANDAGHGVTVVSEPRFDPEGARLRELAGATAS